MNFSSRPKAQKIPPARTRQKTRLQLQFVTNSGHSSHARRVAVAALARRFGLWRKVRQCRGLDSRRDRTRLLAATG